MKVPDTADLLGMSKAALVMLAQDCALHMQRMQQRLDMVLHADRVEGDQLPPIGSTVLIHLSRSDSWVAHMVTGFYVWKTLDLHSDPALGENRYRVFVRVEDSEGYANARSLNEIRYIE